ncbi:MAG: glycosyltransferase family 2 protein [Chloroflexi bacterium]|nr:glycosyltransferase family 2 protein [Chloroflexota bacterium]MBU1747195.1 glycosyltransferase family 2 protein [Chloroflexota bacterium]
MLSQATPSQVRVDAVVPVYNEQEALVDSVTTLHGYLAEHCPYDWHIVIADNASTDRTWAIAQELAARYPRVRPFHLDQKGRGRALRQSWTASDADVVSYMDVDLSTDLVAFMPLIDAIVKDGYEIAIGSRLMRESNVTRGPKREFISRCYNLIIKLMFWHGFSDAQCGFKAVSRRVVKELVPLVKDQAWFFDTELLLLAERKGYSIQDIPVTWVDDPGSTVKITNTAWEDLKGLVRVRFSR